MASRAEREDTGNSVTSSVLSNFFAFSLTNAVASSSYTHQFEKKNNKFETIRQLIGTKLSCWDFEWYINDVVSYLIAVPIEV